MPTFTAIALDSLLEPKNSPRKSSISNEDVRKTDMLKKKPSHIFISPALYVTPKTTPIPDSPGSVSPSPYVVNHKRREVRIQPEIANHLDDFQVPGSIRENGAPHKGLENQIGETDVVAPILEVQQEQDVRFDKAEKIHVSEEVDDFYDPRDSYSVGSHSDTEEWATDRLIFEEKSHLSLSSHNEFYDAPEEFMSDGCSSFASPSSRVNEEVRAARILLLEEIDKRKKAEEAYNHLKGEWLKLAKLVSPEQGDDILDEAGCAEQLFQKVVVARTVSEAIERGIAKAETEIAADAIIASKNNEIVRLRDRLLCYEAMNTEMIQRNQEIIENNRRSRKKKKMKWRWIWGCVGLSITLGTSALAFSYLMQSDFKPMQLLSSNSDSSSDVPDSDGAKHL